MKYASNIEELLGSYFCDLHAIDKEKIYMIEMVDAKSLLRSERIDLVSKIEWVKAKKTGRGLEYATYLYKEQVKAITGRTEVEGGNEDKNSLVAFLETFERLLDIEKTGLDSQISVVPVDKKGCIMDGAHRTAIASYFGLELPIVRLPIDYPAVDTDFFDKNLLNVELIEDIVYKYCKYTSQNVYAICLWPRGNDSEKRKLAEQMIADATTIIYRKEVPFSLKALRNFMIQVYCNFDWLGGLKDNFAGASVKANNCWADKNTTVFYFVEGPSIEKILQLKQNIRNLFQVENHSVHITDNNVETCQIASLILNENSMDLLINGVPDKYQKINLLINEFKDVIKESGANIEDFVVDSSAVLALYGLREANDLDYLSERELKIQNENIDSHNEFLKYHSHSLDELLFNPRHHLYYNGVKFISLETAREFKLNRKETKDIYDAQLIDDLRANKKRIKTQIAKFKYEANRHLKFYIRELKIKIKKVPGIAPLYNLLKKIIKGES